MKTALMIILASAAGLAGGMLLPVPVPVPEKKAAHGNAGKKDAGGKSTDDLTVKESIAIPDSVAAVAVLSGDECVRALEAMLRGERAEGAGSSSSRGERDGVMRALLRRILTENASAEALVKAWRPPLPGRLLADVWLEHADAVPDALRRTLTFLPGGKEASLKIARKLGVADQAKGDAFTATMPGAWRRDVREAVLKGLATREPLRALRALREAGVGGGEDLSEDIAFAAARSAPMEEAVQAILEGVDSDFYLTIKPMMALLRARDPQKAEELVDATGNGQLKRWMTEVKEAAEMEDGQSAAARAAMAKPLAERTGMWLEQGVKELGAQALQDPAAAQSAWAAMPDGKTKDVAAGAVAEAMAERDPLTAMAWAAKYAPQACFDVFQIYKEFDAPGAMQAALQLAEDNPLRARVIKELTEHPERSSFTGLGRIENLEAVRRSLPEDLRKLIEPPAQEGEAGGKETIPFEGVKPVAGTEKKEGGAVENVSPAPAPAPGR